MQPIHSTVAPPQPFTGPERPSPPLDLGRSIEAAGLSAVLESASEGVGEERALSVFRKGAAPAK